ncbi:DNA/RNA non-specific endonuclease [Hymenobacter sp. J193]|uniref:DNA/RNA non-specific endonuclease n=1 Tax=Hymenobacter sp. J193 TaxID=2898429 RepID=UPI002151D086|nr:DNA/RNA non-specific endonuclease [Hymenobacter sp. J193]MCR5886467.1 DNA/RNA non-specific endonuclease [Hymenobacter sp. J193]
MRLFLLPAALLLSAATPACSSQPAETSASSPAAEQPAQAPAGLRETFEQGQKASYAEADEALASGSWHFTDALIGSSEQDHKRGQRAVRLRGQGRLRMNFDAPAGLRQLQVSAAAYGSDAASTWELWGSVDGGRTYRRIGQPVRTQGPRLVVTTFEGSTSTPLRLEIRKTDGGSGRLNIDDIVLSSAAGTASTVAPGTRPAPAASSLPAGATARAEAVVTRRDDNLALGNPSGATASLSTPTNYLLAKPQYTLSYNAQRGTPNWVSWHLNRAWMGSAPRQDDFRPDPALPREFYQVTPRSYSGSGFDRGHNCPSADRTTDLDDNSSTFLMTNMIPQAGANNQRTWSGLEEWTRTQVERGQEVYVVMGCYGKGGTGTAGPRTTLDNGRVMVPARVWKVMVILPEGSNDLQRIAAGQARILAVDTPNDQQVNPDWSRYRVSVDAIEAATGLDLLSALPRPVQEQLESRVDTGAIR